MKLVGCPRHCKLLMDGWNHFIKTYAKAMVIMEEGR